MSTCHCPALMHQELDICASFFCHRPIMIQLPDASALSDSRINPVAVTLPSSGCWEKAVTSALTCSSRLSNYQPLLLLEQLSVFEACTYKILLSGSAKVLKSRSYRCEAPMICQTPSTNSTGRSSKATLLSKPRPGRKAWKPCRDFSLTAACRLRCASTPPTS